MSDVIEGMARAMCTADGRSLDHWYRYSHLATAALDYLKQPIPKPTSSVEGQGPEMTNEQVTNLEHWNKMQPVWQPIVDVLKGNAP